MAEPRTWYDEHHVPLEPESAAAQEMAKAEEVVQAPAELSQEAESVDIEDPQSRHPPTAAAAEPQEASDAGSQILS